MIQVNEVKMEKDIFEIFLDEIQLPYAGKPEVKVNLILAMTWHYPRENMAALTVALPITGEREPYSKRF